ncbi:sensor histidine kinase [Knoellia sp. S7-12]|uniref:sensor histidine kinase n=1 Tax=Knoellia sp. S7-12 TaxID=3126698 RepID=UPI0033686C52
MGAGADDWARRTAGWLVAALILALFATVPVSLSGGVLNRPLVVGSESGLWIGAIVAALALSGAALTHLRPKNVIGWLLLLSGLLQVINISADAYATRALTDPDGSLPLGLACAWLASWTWMPSLLLLVLVLPALYPTGRAPSTYWAWHVRLSMVGITTSALLMAFGPGGVDDTVEGVELPWTLPEWALWAFGVPAAVLLAASAVSTIVGTLVRAVRARTPERQQLLWLLSVVTLMVGTVFTEYSVLFGLSYGLVPVAVVIGVLRYRLLGIEVALRQTLLYVPMTLLVALVVGGLTTALARLVPEGPLPLLAASAVVVALVLPVARRLSVLVDRLVLGERADPLTLVDRVAADLEVAHDDPVAAMLQAVASAASSPSAAVRDTSGRLVAEVGGNTDPTAQTFVVPLRHGGDDLGTLELAMSVQPKGTTDPGRRLAATLAPHLAVVVHARRLTQDLKRERARVTAATLAERDRVRRDLHDGLGPSLSGIALSLEAATMAQDTDPTSVPLLLARTREEADSAVREIRRVVDGLRPAALDLRGLPSAVEDTASMLGLGRQGGVAFNLQADLPATLPPAVEEGAFRILAEALTNVVRHAEATRCDVTIRRSHGDLRLVVSDDGCGLAASNGSGHGLASMLRRATDLNGHLEVTGKQQGGTVITAVLPVGPS